MEIIVLFCAAVMQGESGASPWRYVLPDEHSAHRAPPLRAMVLSDQRPEDVQERVEYRGARQHYGQLRYGRPGSVRLTIVVDERTPDDVDLFVDMDRDRVIEPDERVERAMGPDRGSALRWNVAVRAEIAEAAKPEFARRTLVLQWGSTLRTLSVAAAGYLEGTAEIAGSRYAVRRVDADANGLFADAPDRLWIDLNRDGQWDAFGESFLAAPILSIDDARYAVRGDAEGTRLALEPIEGVGTVRLKLRPADTAARITELTATLVGRDGSAVGLRGGASREVPAGDYRFSAVTVSLTDSAGGAPWSLVFSDNGGRPQYKWYNLEAGESLTLDPIGKLNLSADFGRDDPKCRPGEEFYVTPRLHTADGLLVNACTRGARGPFAGPEDPVARLELATTGGERLATAQSGFA